MKPAREHATNNSQTYFVTSDTWERRAFFRAEPWARLFFKVLLSHRDKAYLLHEFVLMPDHFHLLISPTMTLERAVQLIKGGFSYRVKKEIGSTAEIWQRGFSDHRIRDAEDYAIHLRYIHFNPVKKHLCEAPDEYKYSSAFPGWKLDPVPQRLKPQEFAAAYGTTKVVPFQSENARLSGPEAMPFQSENAHLGVPEAVPFQSENARLSGPAAVPFQNENPRLGSPEAAPFQNENPHLGTAAAVPFLNENARLGTPEAVLFQSTQQRIQPQNRSGGL